MPDKTSNMTLLELLPVWAEHAPDECDVFHYPMGDNYRICYAPSLAAASVSEWTAVDGERSEDAALVLGAVVYHAARRDMEINLSSVYGPALAMPTRVGYAVVKTHEPKGRHTASESRATDDPTALRALATSALTAYLRAIGVDIPEHE